MARPSKAKAIERLEKRLNEIPALKEMERNSDKFKKWRRNTEVAIENTFTDEPSKIEDFTNIRYSHPKVTWSTSDYELQRDYVRGLEEAYVILKSMIEEIEEYWDDESSPEMPAAARLGEMSRTNKVFIVHGHDESARETVARFLGKLELDPIILHEKSNQGRTIIEKFEDYADVGFAVVLLTPDDLGASKDKPDDLQPRARQNAIFELGYFIGKLGRKKVFPLVKGAVEKPSDYDGVVYTDLDNAGGWKTKLIQELKDARFDIDANRAFGST